MIKICKLSRSGNSVYVSLPKPMLRALDLSQADEVAVTTIEGCIAITKVDARRLFNPRLFKLFSAAAQEKPDAELSKS